MSQDRVIRFTGSNYPRHAIVHAVYFHVRSAVSYRDLGEILAERGVHVDHASLNRSVVKYAPLIAAEAQKRKSATGRARRLDETCVRVKGRWTYLYRAVDKEGNTLDFMLSERRDEAAATAFFSRTIQSNGWPDKVVIATSGANLAGRANMNILLIPSGWFWRIEGPQVKYLNNIGAQDPRFIRKLTRPMQGFNSVAAAQATLAGIETAHVIRKGRLAGNGATAIQQFAALAG